MAAKVTGSSPALKLKSLWTYYNTSKNNYCSMATFFLERWDRTGMKTAAHTLSITSVLVKFCVKLKKGED